MSFENLSDKTIDKYIEDQETIVEEVRARVADLYQDIIKVRNNLGSETLMLRILQSERNNRKKYSHKEESQ